LRLWLYRRCLLLSVQFLQRLLVLCMLQVGLGIRRWKHALLLVVVEVVVPLRRRSQHTRLLLLVVVVMQVVVVVLVLLLLLLCRCRGRWAQRWLER
jgi:hypothetical protein